jgi:hypothetical protein
MPAHSEALQKRRSSQRCTAWSGGVDEFRDILNEMRRKLRKLFL